MARSLCSSERAQLEVLARSGLGVGEISGLLGRHRSTVWRELRRNGGVCAYRAEAAQAGAEARARRPKTPKLVGDPLLAAAVKAGLARKWAPHTVAADLSEQGMAICGETIYQGCYRSDRGLPENTWRLLARRRRRRKPRSRCERAKRSVLGGFKPIAQRPDAVAARLEAGHWEGDLIIGAHNRSAVVTLIERVSRYALLAALPNGHTADEVNAAVIAALGRQPAHMVRTLTWDQGREIAHWPKIEKALPDLKVYICDPHSPWQRGSNENTNRIIRRWLPKATDLNIGPVKLAIIEDHLNTMPRRIHNWNSALTQYTAHCRDHQ